MRNRLKILKWAVVGLAVVLSLIWILYPQFVTLLTLVGIVEYSSLNVDVPVSQRSKLRIYWRGASRNLDLHNFDPLKKDPFEELLLYDGVELKKVPHVYGENDFYIECRGKRTRLFRQFKHNSWYFHIYRINCEPSGTSDFWCVYNVQGLEPQEGTAMIKCD